MRIITAVLHVDDQADPPRAGLTVEVDGRPPVLRSDDVEPQDLVATLEALSQAVGVDLTPLVEDQIADVVARLEQQVAQGAERQALREDRLAAWQQATSD